jgi:nucleoside-diphosphate-sugar epimerase
MAPTASGVRPQRSDVKTQRSGAVVAVTGAASVLGTAVVGALADAPEVKRVVAIDPSPPAGRGKSRTAGVIWRTGDVRDPALSAALAGAGAVVHLAGDRAADSDPSQRRALNLRGTETLLTAAAAAAVTRAVLVTSAMVYGASPDNDVPLDEDGPLGADADLTLVGDWVEMERIADRVERAHPSLGVTRVRPASLVGGQADAVLPRLFEAPRLLVLKGSRPHWQFCHTDDLVSALVWAATGRVSGAVTVGGDGWLEQAEVEQISGLRSLVVPSAVAYATAERLHRVGVVPAPASELRYLAHPWVVGSQRLRASGWEPAWTNEAALAEHVGSIAGVRRSGPRVGRNDATRAAAGAAVAVVGTVAIARARAARRRRRS